MIVFMYIIINAAHPHIDREVHVQNVVYCGLATKTTLLIFGVFTIASTQFLTACTQILVNEANC